MTTDHHLLWHLDRRTGPVIVNVPHAGIELPGNASWTAQLTAAALAMPDTDWHVEKLYGAIAPALDVTLMSARQSRFVVDLNRDPSGVSLYPGASNTEICPVTTFHDEAVYAHGSAPDAVAVNARVQEFFHPYHAALAAEVARIRQMHGYCILLDGHSIVAEAPRFFEGRLPDLNLGTADVTTCAPGLADTAFTVLAGAAGFTAVHNGRFKGGYITRCFGRPQEGVHALQLEMAQACYMDEANPRKFDQSRAQPLIDVLETLLRALLAWRPQ